MTRRSLLMMTLAALGVASLAGCGKKGPPEVPAGQVDTLNSRKYPNKE